MTNTKIKVTDLKRYATSALIDPSKDLFFRTFCDQTDASYCLNTVKIKLMTRVNLTDAEIKECIRLLTVAGVKATNATTKTHKRTPRRKNPAADSVDAGSSRLAGN